MYLEWILNPRQTASETGSDMQVCLVVNREAPGKRKYHYELENDGPSGRGRRICDGCLQGSHLLFVLMIGAGIV